MNLTFAQAARGVNKEVTLNVVDTCQKCSGSRCELGTKAIKCHQCNGTGMETISTGPFVMRSTCRSCHGSRVYIKFPCMECEGKGQSVSLKYSYIFFIIIKKNNNCIFNLIFRSKKKKLLFQYQLVLKMVKQFVWQLAIKKSL